MIFLRFALLHVAVAALAAAVPSDVPRWLDAHPEARWVTLEADLAQQPDGLAAWVAFLATHNDTQQLEWLALARDFRLPAEALVGLDADNWPRVAWWTMTQHWDSHSMEAAEDLMRLPVALKQQRIDRAAADGLAMRHQHAMHAWLHAQPGLEEIADAHFTAATQGMPPASTTSYQPVLTPEAVFAPLRTAATVVDLGRGESAVPGRPYAHQVYRALDILVRSARYQPEWLAAAEALTTHSHPGLRSAAWRFFAALPGRYVPYRRAWQALAAEDATISERQAALLALSASDDPATELVLLSLAERPGPLRALAISRLCDRGDAWVLSQLEVLVLDPISEAGLAAQRADLRQRVERTPFPPLVPALRRAAAADLVCDPREGVLAAWTMDMASRALNQPDPVGKQTRSQFEQLASYSGETDRVAVRTRAWATALLSGKRSQAAGTGR